MSDDNRADVGRIVEKIVRENGASSLEEGTLRALVDFAYKQGFHELGYDPVAAYRDLVAFAATEKMMTQIKGIAKMVRREELKARERGVALILNPEAIYLPLEAIAAATEAA